MRGWVLFALFSATGFGQQAGAPFPQELAGRWILREGTGSTYRDSRTGQTSAPNASVFTYTIYPDGRYEHAALISSTLYQCTMQIFGYESGHADVAGNTITFTDQAASLKSTDNCRPQFNYEKPGKTGSLNVGWRLERYPQGTKLVLFDRNGKEQTFYRETAR